MFYNKYIEMSQVTLKQKKAKFVLKNATFLNVFTEEWLTTDIAIDGEYIVGIGDYSGEIEIDYSNKFIIPGFFDAHLHVESSMIRPALFFQKAAKTGTTSFIIDPHEAGNVSGIKGIDYIIEESRQVKPNVYIMAPSCVPATPLEDNGAVLRAEDLKKLLKYPEVLGLAEVMDYPSLENCDTEMLKKLSVFENRIKDGHSAGLHSKKLSNYALAGITTDHEATSYEEALELIRRGIHVHIREGSAACNLNAIVEGVVKYNMNTEMFSFCTDDKHVSDIEKNGHIVENVRRAIKLGIPAIKAFKMASINTARCYKLDRIGAISVGYKADFIVLDDIENVNILEVYIGGELFKEKEIEFKLHHEDELMNTVKGCDMLKEQLMYPIKKNPTDVIEIIKGEILTNHLIEEVPIVDGYFVSNGEYNKIAVIERHHNTGKVGLGIIKGFNLKNAAIATSVGHDSHNITVVSDNDEDMLFAVEKIKEMQGGFVLVSNQKIIASVPLRIMGLMSEESVEVVERKLQIMQKECQKYGVPTDLEVFLVLSFVSLSVIPSLRITARGLYDVINQKFKI